MAHPWHLVMMRRHHEIEPLTKESSALRVFLRYCHGSAPSAKHLGLQGGSAHLSFAGIVHAAPTLSWRGPCYEALGRLASGHRSPSGRFNDAKTREVTKGEHRHLILQSQNPPSGVAGAAALAGRGRRL